MTDQQILNCRHFVTYSGVKLPLKLVTLLEDDDLERRITFFRGYFDEAERLMKVEKVVYGEIEFEHHYQYYDDGRLKTVELIEDGAPPRVMAFD